MRPEILFPLFGPIGSLKGVGERVAPLLQRVAGPRVRDLVFLPPQGFVHRRRALARELVEGEVQTKTESGKDQPAVLLTPVGITRDNLDVVVKADWITKEKLCDGVTDNPPDACK